MPGLDPGELTPSCQRNGESDDKSPGRRQSEGAAFTRGQEPGVQQRNVGQETC